MVSVIIYRHVDGTILRHMIGMVGVSMNLRDQRPIRWHYTRQSRYVFHSSISVTIVNRQFCQQYWRFTTWFKLLLWFSYHLRRSAHDIHRIRYWFQTQVCSEEGSQTKWPLGIIATLSQW